MRSSGGGAGERRGECGEGEWRLWEGERRLLEGHSLDLLLDCEVHLVLLMLCGLMRH